MAEKRSFLWNSHHQKLARLWGNRETCFSTVSPSYSLNFNLS